MFNNLKIGVRLGLGFAFVLLMLAAISILSITRINELNAGIDELAEGRIPKIVMADELSLNVQLIGRGVRNMIMTSDKAVEKQQTEAIAKARSRNAEIYEKMTPLVLTEKGKALLAKATDARTKYNGVTDRLLSLADTSSPQYNPDKATQLLFGEYTDVAGVYVTALNEFAAFQIDGARKAGPTPSSWPAPRAPGHHPGLGGLRAGGPARPVADPQHHPPDQPGGGCRQEDGRRRFQLHPQERREGRGRPGGAGRRGRAARRPVDVCRRLPAGHRGGGRPPGHPRRCRQAPGRFPQDRRRRQSNPRLGDRPLNVAANYVDRISKGDIPAKITDTYNGDFNTIKNNLNTCIEAVNKLVADAGVLAKAAVEGRLATRADATQHQGDFRKIVEGVNDTLDAVINPSTWPPTTSTTSPRATSRPRSPTPTTVTSTPSRTTSTPASRPSTSWSPTPACSRRPPSKAASPPAPTPPSTRATSARSSKASMPPSTR
jgi:methyl-accepting chemotaxis protein